MRPLHRVIDLPVRADERGRLAFAQQPDHIPFGVKRVFYLYDLSSGASRGGHAHRRQEQFIIMMAGTCRVSIDSGAGRQVVELTSPSRALYVPPLIWLDLEAFGPASVCMVLASDVYDESDYIRDRDEFDRIVQRL